MGAIKPPRRVGVWLGKAASQSIGSNAVTSVAWDTEHSDAYGFHPAGSASIIVPGGLDGLYAIHSTLTWNNGTTSYRRLTYININGVVRAVSVGGLSSNADYSSTNVLALMLQLRAGDDVQVHAHQDSGGTQALFGTNGSGLGPLCVFSMARIGG